MLNDIVRYVLDLGAPVMMPLIITTFGLLLGQGFARSFRAGLTVGVGFIAIGLVVGLLVGVVGPKSMAFAKVLGLKFDVLDVGWPMGAAVSFASPIAAALIPAVLLLNVLLVVTRVTRTVDVDLWNYWHFIYTGALIHAATGSLTLGVFGACITAFVIFKLADWTAPAVEHHFGLPGISLPHTETVNWAPFMYALERIERKIPGLSKWEIRPETIRKRLGLIGEPILMGAVLGALIGALGAIPMWNEGHYGAWLKEVLTLAVTMSAVLIVLPKVVAILMEGLIPVSEGARDYLRRRLPGHDLLIGLDAAVVIGHPANMAIALLCVPLMILLSVFLPGNRMLPFADMAALPFYVLWGVAASRGNMVRGLLNAIVILVFILWIGTSLGPLTTELARAAGFRPEVMGEAGQYQEWSGVALGSHIVPWIVLHLFCPSAPGFWLAVLGAMAFFAAWYWVRDELRMQYKYEDLS
ncbi:PTS galactitol transporter subunit IIC [Pendulispora albinea]|uniref:PTS EIIC type-2 domain-containing protein n=1 Tax=Pendulispora albinea TaxID=2741071 RepID=A0ABZ2LK92_9BACT